MGAIFNKRGVVLSGEYHEGGLNETGCHEGRFRKEGFNEEGFNEGGSMKGGCYEGTPSHRSTCGRYACHFNAFLLPC